MGLSTDSVEVRIDDTVRYGNLGPMSTKHGKFEMNILENGVIGGHSRLAFKNAVEFGKDIKLFD